MEIHLRTTGCRLPYGITQYYLPPDTSEHTLALTPASEGRYSIYLPGGMEGWVALGCWLHTVMVYPPTVIHPSINRARRRVTTLIETNALPARPPPSIFAC